DRAGRPSRSPGRPEDGVPAPTRGPRRPRTVLAGAGVRRAATAVTRFAAVTFDAAGTLFDVAEPVGVTYARAPARHGLRLAADDAERRFRDALAAAPSLAFPRVDPTHRRDMERAWWHAIVQAAYGEAARAPAFEACFAELFAYYADPAAWEVFGDVRP